MLWTQLDTDLDGVKNVDDAFPRDATEFLDTDKDGVGNLILTAMSTTTMWTMTPTVSMMIFR